MTNLPSSIKEAEITFTTMLHSDFFTQFFYHTIAFIVITYIVSKGIKSGIEKLNDYLMPALIVILSGMFFYALTLDSFSKAFEFMFAPDWSKLNSQAFVTAVGHAFFTLSLGMGAIMTYAASMEKNTNIVSSALWVVFLDTAIALVAGLMLFTFLYEYGAGPDKGPGLVFISLPAAFYEMGGIGNFFAIIFFIALAFAGLTSAVSLVEPMVQYGIDRFKLTRKKASILMGLFFYLIGILVILSGLDDTKEIFTWGGKNLFDWIDFITAAVMLPFGGLLMSIFVGYVIPKSEVEATLKPYLKGYFGIWYFSLRYIAPISLFIVMLNLIGAI
jgi:NSS family neurotransmitter:Na+ symporter